MLSGKSKSCLICPAMSRCAIWLHIPPIQLEVQTMAQSAQQPYSDHFPFTTTVVAIVCVHQTHTCYTNTEPSRWNSSQMLTTLCALDLKLNISTTTKTRSTYLAISYKHIVLAWLVDSEQPGDLKCGWWSACLYRTSNSSWNSARDTAIGDIYLCMNNCVSRFI